MTTENNVNPEVTIELIESNPKKSSKQQENQSYSPNLIGWLLVIASIPMGYTIQSFSFTADFMPFTCEKNIDKITISKFEGQYVRNLQFMQNSTRNLYNTNHTQISQQICEEIKTGDCNVVFYNKNGFKEEQRTLRISYNLICDREWLTPFSTTMAFCGNAVGSLVGGWFSDRFGRRPVYTSVFYKRVCL